MADHDDDMLDAFFDAGRKSSAAAPEALLHRIEADALAELEQRQATVPKQRRGWREAFGGWQIGVGLASAAAAGLVIGIAMPEGLANYDTLGLLTSVGEFEDFALGYGTDFFEEG